MLDCRLNWRRAGRLERAKECRGIKREQKGPPPPISLLPSFSRLLLPLARSSPLVLRPRAHGARDRHIRAHPLSAVLSYASLSLPCALLPSLSSLDKSPRLFVTHRISSSSFNRALPSIRALLFRSHARKARRTIARVERKREIERRKYFRNAARENPFRSFVTRVLLLLIKRGLRWIAY